MPICQPMLELHHPLAARILADPDRAALLKPFMRAPMSLKCAADELKVSLQALHYRVGQMLEAGLLQVVGEEARQGRPIKVYRATAAAFEVPIQKVPPPLLERLETHATWKRLFEEGFNLLASNGYGQGNLRVGLGEDGNLIWSAGGDQDPRPLELDEDQPALLDFWSAGVRLSREEAKRLQQELWQLYERYAGRSQGERYVLHLGLVPRPGG
ncbi:MAG: helix-turn-helix domain-containing protein [Thermaceae bacterium]|nr:helix-turn-helix domain-containing protein [Thermaceae bacterium]